MHWGDPGVHWGDLGGQWGDPGAHWAPAQLNRQELNGRVGACTNHVRRRRKLDSIHSYWAGVALQGNSRHTAPGGRYVIIF